MYPRYTEKVPCRYRSTGAEFRGVEVESWAGRAGNGMAWDGTRCRVWQRWLHSCIRAPQRNLVSSQGSVVCIEVEVEVVRARISSLCMHARASCVSWVHNHPHPPHTHLSTAPHLRQPSGPRRDASPNLLSSPILDNITPALCCRFLLLLLLLFCSSTTTPTAATCLLACLLACLPACLLASVVGSSQLLLPRQKVEHRIASAHLQAHLRHLPHPAPGLHHACPSSIASHLIISRRRPSPSTFPPAGLRLLPSACRHSLAALDSTTTTTPPPPTPTITPPGPPSACSASLSV